MGPAGATLTENDVESKHLFACRKYPCSSGSLSFRPMRLPFKLRVNLEGKPFYLLGTAVSCHSFSLVYTEERAFSNLVCNSSLRSGKVPLENPFVADIIV